MEATTLTTDLPEATRRRALLLLFGVLLLVMLGFSVLFPVEPYYVRTFGADAQTMGLIVGIYSTMQFICAPLWGRLSDRVGRRPVLMVGLLGYVVSQTFFGLATSLWMLFAARTLAGTLSAAAMPTAMAYIADITPPDDRAKGMGMVGAAFGLGVIIGPAIGGVLGSIWLPLPFLLSAGLAALALLLVGVGLPESLPAAARGAPHEPWRARWAALAGNMSVLYGITFVLSIAMAAVEVTFGFFAADRLSLQPNQTSGLFVAMGIVAAAVQLGLVGRLQRAIGEGRMLLLGLALSALGMVAVTLSYTVPVAVLAICVLSVGVGLARPSSAALISRRAPGGQGVVIGLMDSIDSLGRIGGPLAGGALYREGVALPYLAGAALFALALAVGGAWSRRVGLLERPG